MNKDIKKYCVYQHIRLDTNEVFYVGIGTIRRPYERLRRSLWWKNIVCKTQYKVEILYTDLDRATACDKERELIAYYGRRDQKKGPLINQTDGGDGGATCLGKTLTQEHKDAVSRAQKGRPKSTEVKELWSQQRKGRLHTEESKQKMRERSFVNKSPEEQELIRQKMRESHAKRPKTPLTEEQRQTKSLSMKRSLANQLHIKKLAQMKIGKPRSEETKQKLAAASRKGVIEMYQYDTMKLLGVFADGQEILKAYPELKVTAGIYKVINGKTKQNKGFYFKRINKKEEYVR